MTTHHRESEPSKNGKKSPIALEDHYVVVEFEPVGKNPDTYMDIVLIEWLVLPDDRIESWPYST
jgi:hypothetical protein